MAEVSTTTPILQFTGVRKAFGDAEVLHGIDLAVERGEVVAVLGPSGSGKTTLLRCTNLLEHADAGELALDGVRFDLARVTAKEAAEIRRNTAFVFQSYNLFRNRTVLGNVAEGLVVAHRMPKDEAREIAVRCLERVGMAGRLDAYPVQLSGGQQQRVAIARHGDEPESCLLRRADFGARSRADGRGARRHARPRPRRHDHGGRDARDGLRAECCGPRGVYGAWRGSGRGARAGVLRPPSQRTRPRVFRHRTWFVDTR